MSDRIPAQQQNICPDCGADLNKEHHKSGWCPSLGVLPPQETDIDRAIQRLASAYVARGGAISDSITAECIAAREALRTMFVPAAGMTARSERDFEQAIDERDAAEECLSQMYYLVTGRSPEWSNNFGHEQALEDVSDVLAALKSAVKLSNATGQSEPKSNSTEDGESAAKQDFTLDELVSDMTPENVHPEVEVSSPAGMEVEGKAKAALAYLIDHIVYSDSYGVHGSDFQCCHLCSAGGAPGIPFKHDDTCPVSKCEAIAEEWWTERREEVEDLEADLKAKVVAVEGIAPDGELVDELRSTIAKLNAEVWGWRGQVEETTSKLDDMTDLLKQFVYAYEEQDADNFTDSLRSAYAAADAELSSTERT